MKIDRTTFTNNRYLGEKISASEYLRILPYFDKKGFLPIVKEDEKYFVTDHDGNVLFEIYWISGKNGIDVNDSKIKEMVLFLKKNISIGTGLEQVKELINSYKESGYLGDFNLVASDDQLILENPSMAMVYPDQRWADARLRENSYDDYKSPKIVFSFAKDKNKGIVLRAIELEDQVISGNSLSSLKLSDLESGYLIEVGQENDVYLIFGDYMVSTDQAICLKHVYTHQLNVNDILEDEFSIKAVYRPRRPLNLTDLMDIDRRDPELFEKL